MVNFILGTGASLFAVFLIWIFKECIIPEIKRRLFNVCPLIAGNYELIKMETSHPNIPDEAADIRKVELKQCGSKIWGYIISNEVPFKSRLDGQITGSRILNFRYEPENKNIHSYGTGMLKLSFKGEVFKGVLTFLCECCEDITPAPVIMRKITYK
ncbi:MAG: hypothetical protein NT088_04500 [Candidatus Omnitrophica bacterium]|nr:hypothetical protein [Candidatus Omnitrophota bacterium]